MDRGSFRSGQHVSPVDSGCGSGNHSGAQNSLSNHQKLNTEDRVYTDQQQAPQGNRILQNHATSSKAEEGSADALTHIGGAPTMWSPQKRTHGRAFSKVNASGEQSRFSHRRRNHSDIGGRGGRMSGQEWDTYGSQNSPGLGALQGGKLSSDDRLNEIKDLNSVGSSYAPSTPATPATPATPGANTSDDESAVSTPVCSLMM